MRILSAFCLFLLLLGFGAPSARAESPMLVELFASKNCLSCPAAHRNMRALAAEQPGLLILTWSVDYWDYLGGKDKMALPESKERQRGYVERFSLRGPYTPQTVFNGGEHAAGNKSGRLAAAHARAAAHADRPEVLLVRDGDRLSLTGDPGGLTDIWWICYLAGEDNPTDMVNPVRSVRQIGPWLGGRADIDLPECESGCALVVQEAGFGRVLAALDVR